MVERQIEKQSQLESGSAQTTTAAALHADAYAEHPGLLARSWNVTKSIARGAADRLSDDVTNFSDHPLRSTADLVGTTAAAGLAIAGSVEVGAAVATYAGVATISTEMGALFGAGTAAAIMGPGADALQAKTVTDWKNTSEARSTVADPSAHSAEQVASAQNQIGQTLGRDALSSTELYGGLAAGAAAAELLPGAGTSASRKAISYEGVDTRVEVSQVAANDNLSVGVRRNADGTLRGIDGLNGSGFSISRDRTTNEPKAVFFHDGVMLQSFTKNKVDGTWSNDHNPAEKATVNVDDKTGVSIYTNGDEYKLGVDGKRTMERFDGYKQISDVRLSGESAIEHLKLPNNGPELVREALPDGQSRMMMTLNGKTYLSESGNAQNGWLFKSHDGQASPGQNNSDTLMKITEDDPNSRDLRSGFAVSLTDTNGMASMSYGKGGWQTEFNRDGESTSSQTSNASGRLMHSEVNVGNQKQRYFVDNLGGREFSMQIIEQPGLRISVSPNKSITLTLDGAESKVSNLRELRDAKNPGRVGFSVDTKDGQTKTFWSDVDYSKS